MAVFPSRLRNVNLLSNYKTNRCVYHACTGCYIHPCIIIWCICTSKNLFPSHSDSASMPQPTCESREAPEVQACLCCKITCVKVEHSLRFLYSVINSSFKCNSVEHPVYACTMLPIHYRQL